VQVGTSRDSSVSGGADYPFTLTQTREYCFSVVSPFPTRIHLPSELDDPSQTFAVEVFSSDEQPTDGCEPLKIQPLSRQQRLMHEVRNDPLDEIAEPTGFPLERLVAAVWPDTSASEESLDRMKHFGAISVLADGQAWPYLPSHGQLGPWRDGDGKAAFAVNISRDVRREKLATVPGAGV
jgi:hypothetical protein